MHAETTIDTVLRIGAPVAMLAICGCASTGFVEPVTEPVSAHRSDMGAIELPEPAGDAGLVPSTADPTADRSRSVSTVLPERTVVAPVEDAAEAAGASRPASGRRLATREKRIFVLGLAAREKK
jgi:hypothetical protein